MPLTPAKYKPRFQRAGTIDLIPQSRDLQILYHIHKHRFLTSEHIAALVPGGQQGIRRRLYKLFHGGYLDRPREQIRPFRQGGDPYVYGIGRKGYELLSRTNSISRSKSDWTAKNREVKQRYINHTLAVAHFMVCLELACRKDRHISLLEPREILNHRPAKPGTSVNAFGWAVEMVRKTKSGPKKIRISITPDKVFGLYFLDRPPTRSRTIFFLEADRSTMPIKRSGLYGSSYQKKMICYWESWRQNLYEKIFGCKAVRILTLTKPTESVNAPERIRHMIEACKAEDRQGRGSRMFLFTQSQDFSLTNPDRVLKKVWQNAQDKELVSLSE